MSSEAWRALGWWTRLRYSVLLQWWVFRMCWLENEPREGQISFLGTAPFVARLREALGLLALRAPHAYQLTQNNLGCIIESPHDGLLLEEERGWLGVALQHHPELLELTLHLAHAAHHVKYLRRQAAGAPATEQQKDEEAASFGERVLRELQADEASSGFTRPRN